ncbi:hypothetical protein SUH3_07370 [Pseudosulfitobacter pseudonitzschiae]|uniref:Uncharacterized protein n=1 Tax=Pseudosulfitobacter pseudonitzschiae TaxID=1402135 RepID=A0A073J9C5_9RHOB|nr:hypothetical protein SUH3_07370 [Pseudosulfitobacter pseudonitzschiae]
MTGRPTAPLLLACAAKVGFDPLPHSPARIQGRRPPRIAGPPHGAAIWLMVCVTDRWDVFGCY